METKPEAVTETGAQLKPAPLNALMLRRLELKLELNPGQLSISFGKTKVTAKVYSSPRDSLPLVTLRYPVESPPEWLFYAIKYNIKKLKITGSL